MGFLTLSSLWPCLVSPFSWGEESFPLTSELSVPGPGPAVCSDTREAGRSPGGWTGVGPPPPSPGQLATLLPPSVALLSPAFRSLNRLVLTSPPVLTSAVPLFGSKKGALERGCHLRSAGSGGGGSPLFLLGPKQLHSYSCYILGFHMKFHLKVGQRVSWPKSIFI